jgi:Predicted acyl-CoA transferases/carnitine dehydratase
LPLYGIYQSADGYLALGAIEEHFAARVREVVGTEVTHAALQQAFAAHDTKYWSALADRLDIPLTPIGLRQADGESA